MSLDEQTLNLRINTLCHALEFQLHPLRTKEDVLQEIRTLVAQRDNLRKMLVNGLQTSKPENK